MRSAFAALALTLLTGCHRHAAANPRVAPQPVVVTLVIDQFAAWIAESRFDTLPADGGFARLRREGTWAHAMRFEHAATDTAPGHCALYTGVVPHESGIYANEVVDPSGERVSVLRDRSTHEVTPEGIHTTAGSSLAPLRVPTLADRVHDLQPQTMVVSLSLKDRAALFGSGHHPDAVLWYDTSLGTFVTSTAFTQQFPTWAARDGNAAAMQRLRATPWQPLDVDWVRAHAAMPDDEPGEGDLDGFGTTFPHAFERARRPAAAMRASPRGDEALLALATDAVERAESLHRPLLLAVSLSSNDYVGHVFGPDSWESWDELRRLDASLAAFFRELDRRVGAAHWSLLLAADHGVITMPEASTHPETEPWCTRPQPDRFERPCGPTARLLPDVLASELQQRAVGVLGPGHWVQGTADGFVYLTADGQALAADRMRTLLDALTAQLSSHPEILEVVEPARIAATCPPETDESLDALVCRSIPIPCPAVLYAITRPGAFMDANYSVGHGTSHGTAYLYDRTVPFLVRAPGRVDAGHEIVTPISYRAYAATAASLLGIAWPDRDAHSLTHAGR